jgi:dihydroceramide fatty acyl 2-hydroxylase
MRKAVTTVPQELSPRMFDNPLLERLSRVHPAVPPLIYLPVVTVLLVLAIGKENLGVAPIAAVFLCGLAFWSLAEYLLHRFVFHFQPDTRWGRRLHFIIHGVHHDYPHDPMRLVMPPSVSVPLALVFYVLFWLILGADRALAFGAGFYAGYLLYDMIHYHLHHRVPRTRMGKRLRELHLRHHFQDDERGFGISAPWWDVVFRTVPRKRS